MNYEYFSQLEAGSLVAENAETEQQFMERILSAVFAEQEAALAGQVNDLMAPVFCSCSAEHRSLTVAFTAQQWMLNPNGTLHGGMISTAVDMVMTVLGRYVSKKRTVVTAQLSMKFMRAVAAAQNFTVTATADHVGRRSMMLHASVIDATSGKPVATATAVLM